MLLKLTSDSFQPAASVPETSVLPPGQAATPHAIDMLAAGPLKKIACNGTHRAWVGIATLRCTLRFTLLPSSIVPYVICGYRSLQNS